MEFSNLRPRTMGKIVLRNTRMPMNSLKATQKDLTRIHNIVKH